MTDRYAVIGNPINHTKSPLIHCLFAQTTGQDMVYTALLGTPGAFAQDVAAFREAGGRGMNVTVPFKMDAFACATEPSERARMAGAVNALKFEGDRILAENFDGIGLTRDVTHNLGVPLDGQAHPHSGRRRRHTRHGHAFSGGTPRLIGDCEPNLGNRAGTGGRGVGTGTRLPADRLCLCRREQ
jgi:hypothetical protein